MSRKLLFLSTPVGFLGSGAGGGVELTIPLRVFGRISDPVHWQNLQDSYSFDLVDYRGFLPTGSLQKELGDCFVLVMTPRWVEAFGNGAIEAFACGVPVIAYRRGGSVEIIEDGKTGFFVEPDSIEGLVTAIKNLDRIDRDSCRCSSRSKIFPGSFKKLSY